ncbi:STAS domain-containing protein [Clostridium magnum]|uniref:Anti-sigma factor antagonist n=1 Tax=Clostridium magnum DSM 2767 TaxID=1121326 RepID=A0A161WKK8_9CLOT|nr:STAS domain-containing protein [Clostridium magnum]KZL92265.1 anti-sigma-B factor antagonist [Clostridium magnum DSM 2767]SHH15687.1 anti-sigma B factor antagonist [Clostridium magnum DSM 2767]
MKEIEILIPEDFAVEEASVFREKLNKLIDRGERHFILNFKNCTFVDSTGLGVLVGIYKRSKEVNGSLQFSSVVAPKVIKIFKLTRLDKVFGIE